ncbi:hypothetical protein Tco_1004129 [Tanacetum coccineum]|uniref:Uncharacterized protein n=1 Tax=Tanacetum coccineum TaxID=301880 RepID=A0ABQ5FBE9_9ASTR
MPTEPSGIADSPSLDADLAPTDSETEFDEEVHGINAGDQDQGQAGPNPGVQDEGQARSNPGDENLKLPIEDQGPPRPMVFKEPDFRRFQPLPEVQDEAVIDLIHQDSSSVPLMTIMVIDLSLLHSVSIIVHALLPTSTATTTTITTITYLPKPPPQP